MRILLFLFLCLTTCILPSSFNDFISRIKSLPPDQRKPVIKEFLEKKGTTPIIENDTLIHFIWFGKADTVLITGDLQNGWASKDTLDKIKCGDENVFSKSYTIPHDSRLNYIYIVNGQYQIDPLNPRTVSAGYGSNSEAVMPKFVNNPVLEYKTEIAHGSLDSLFFQSKDTTIKSRQIKIYLPAGYEKLSGLPSVYIFNGTEALKSGMYKNVFDNLIAGKEICPVIAVFITPADGNEEFIGGKRKNLSNAVCSELVPLIDSLYRTSKDPLKRAVMGTSYSGNITFATVLERTDLFLNVASQSIIEEELYGILSEESNKKVFPKELKAYIDYGIFEYNGPMGNLVNVIRFLGGCIQSYGINLTLIKNHDGHSWQNWSRYTDKILKYFFAKTN